MTDKKLYRMAGIGELLWDLLPGGKQLGGSPMNVVYHCQEAGIESVVVSAVGNDPLGREIIEQVEKSGNSSYYIQKINNSPTGTVSITLNNGIPNFKCHNNVAWDFIQWSTSLEELAQGIDAVAFGSLAQRNPVSQGTIIKFLQTMKPHSIKVFDINLRQKFHSRDLIAESLKLATILKINDEELPVLIDYLDIKGVHDNQIKWLLDTFDLDIVAYTMGSQGSILYTQDQKSVRKAPEVEIKDTVGAGDTFTAFLIAGLLNNKPLDTIHQEATDAAAWVCTQKGGTPAYIHKA